jgi:arogenate dehydrogenase (NADP+)
MAYASRRVLATSRRPYYEEAAAIGATFYEDVDDFCEEHPDVVILASSILSTEAVLASLPVQRLKRSTLFVDVLSVKVRPGATLEGAGGQLGTGAGGQLNIGGWHVGAPVGQ